MTTRNRQNTPSFTKSLIPKIRGAFPGLACRCEVPACLLEHAIGSFRWVEAEQLSCKHGWILQRKHANTLSAFHTFTFHSAFIRPVNWLQLSCNTSCQSRLMIDQPEKETSLISYRKTPRQQQQHLSNKQRRRDLQPMATQSADPISWSQHQIRTEANIRFFMLVSVYFFP